MYVVQDERGISLVKNRRRCMHSSFAGAPSRSCFWFSSAISLCRVGLRWEEGSGLLERESSGSFLSDGRASGSEMCGERILSLIVFTFFSGGGDRVSSSWLPNEGLVSLGTLLL